MLTTPEASSPAGEVIPNLEYLLRPYNLRAGVLLGPDLREESAIGGSVPILIVTSAADADIGEGRRPITRYDRSPLEADFSASEVPRAMVYSWGTFHDAFGGGPGGASDTGQAILDGYVPAFAAANVFRDPTSVATWWSYLTRETYPASVLDPGSWDHTLDFTHQSPVHCARVPLGDCDATLGCEVRASACEQIDCDELDAQYCESNPGCVLSAVDACMHLPRLRTSYTVDQAGKGTRIPVEFFETQEEPDHRPAELGVSVEDAAVAIDAVNFDLDGAPTGHDTSLMLVQWGGAFADDGEIYIDLPEGTDLGKYSHLSLRVGNVLDKTTANDACDVASTDAVSFELGVREQMNGVTMAQSAFLSTGRIVQNDFAYLTSVSTACRGQQTMNTIRFPLAPFCSGVGTVNANQLVLRFPESTDVSRVLIDTIELTASTLDTLADCGSFAAAWQCQVDDLVVTETACSDEPTPTCDTADITTTTLLAPLVEPPGDDDYRGWYVQTPPGAIVDPEDPTAAELAHVLARCVWACELEYAANPDVAANCSAASAFLDPVFTTFDAHASRYDIPEAYANGAGLYSGESLACDLRTDCCEAFDDDLCAARPVRVTEARQAVGRNEDWLYGVDGVLILESSFAAEPIVADLTGSIGGSLCPAGNATAACPIYIGSADIELVEPVTLALSCDGQTINHTLDSLQLSLAQPAFGIQSHNYPDWSAFPPGGLVFEAHTVVDDLEFDTLLPNDHGASMMFNAGWATLPYYGNFEVTFDLPCNGEMADIEASFGLVATSWIGSPPTGSITVPSTVTCPSTRALTTTGSDAQNDVVSVRWKVDGVLLAAGVTSMPFTRAHTLQAIVRDSRGATKTLTKSVTCN